MYATFLSISSLELQKFLLLLVASLPFYSVPLSIFGLCLFLILIILMPLVLHNHLQIF